MPSDDSRTLIGDLQLENWWKCKPSGALHCGLVVQVDNTTPNSCSPKTRLVRRFRVFAGEPLQ